MPSAPCGLGWRSVAALPFGEGGFQARYPLPSLPLQVRIGIHTGLVVAGEMGVGDQPEPLGIVGETPNIAARIQGLAAPNTVIISAATHRLVGGHFECQPFGSHLVKGIDTPIAVYHVQSERQSVSPLAGKTMLTPLVGREQEVGLVLRPLGPSQRRPGPSGVARVASQALANPDWPTP